MCIVPMRLSCLCSEFSLSLWMLSSWHSTSSCNRSSGVLDGLHCTESNVAEECVRGCVRFCDILAEENEAGRQDHESCFGRGQGMGGGGWDVQLCLAAPHLTCHLKILAQRKLSPRLCGYQFLYFLEHIDLYSCNSHPFLLISYSKIEKPKLCAGVSGVAWSW